MNYKEKFEQVGVRVPRPVMPVKGTNLTKYAVIACDQYNAQPEYWEQVKKLAEGSPSALSYIMPEAWLGKDGKPDSAEHLAHQESIPVEMGRLLSEGFTEELEPGMIYLKRTLKDGMVRQGLILCLDLEEYDYTPGSKSLIRATEKTVPERIPVRKEIRAKSPLECSHIMVLYADPENKLNSLLGTICCGDMDTENGTDKKPLYDFDLMMGAGRLTGYFINEERELEQIADALLELKKNAKDGMLFAMGDGNHSLAAAKANWESVKIGLTQELRKTHPARFALVELVNLYDEALTFEPINRIIYNVNPEKLQKELNFNAEDPISLQELQPKLDEYLKVHPEAGIDYIHGVETAKKLQAKDPKHSLAVCWKEFDRDSLFDDVIRNGCLVRKSFSMGCADDKRFYFEARKIKW